jgi:hypothetical protein
MMAPSLPEVRAALRTLIAESCRRDLSKVFVEWLMQESERGAGFASIATQAAQRDGADQDFQTIAILGFAADAGLLSELQFEAFKRGLSKLAGRSPMVSGVPMAFCADAAGILGVAVGTRSIKDPILTGKLVGWATKFLRASYERGGVDDWQRCLFAVADRQLGGTLGLPVPKSAATADVRTALAAKGLIEVGDGNQARDDEGQALELVVQEPQNDFSGERTALRLAALARVIRTAAATAKSESAAHSARKTNAPVSKWSARVPIVAIREQKPGTSRRKRRLDPTVQRIKDEVRNLKNEGLDYKSICDRLGQKARPPRSTWRDFSWPVAYKRRTSAVTKWLSEASS